MFCGTVETFDMIASPVKRINLLNSDQSMDSLVIFERKQPYLIKMLFQSSRDMIYQI